jgi:hypothetical protein
MYVIKLSESIMYFTFVMFLTQITINTEPS